MAYLWAAGSAGIPPQPALAVATALRNAGLSLSGNATVDITSSGPHVVLPLGTFLTFSQQRGLDAEVEGWGASSFYPMTATAPQPTVTPSTVTVTATVGDPTYSGSVQWATGSTPVLQGTTTATAGVATIAVTGNASGPLVVWAYVPEYTAPSGQQAGGYSSVTLQFP